MTWTQPFTVNFMCTGGGSIVFIIRNGITFFLFEVSNNLMAYCPHNESGFRLTGSLGPFSHCLPFSSRHSSLLPVTILFALPLDPFTNPLHNLHNCNSLQQKIVVVCSLWPLPLQAWHRLPSLQSWHRLSWAFGESLPFLYWSLPGMVTMPTRVLSAQTWSGQM